MSARGLGWFSSAHRRRACSTKSADGARRSLPGRSSQSSALAHSAAPPAMAPHTRDSASAMYTRRATGTDHSSRRVSGRALRAEVSLSSVSSSSPPRRSPSAMTESRARPPQAGRPRSRSAGTAASISRVSSTSRRRPSPASISRVFRRRASARAWLRRRFAPRLTASVPSPSQARSSGFLSMRPWRAHFRITIPPERIWADIMYYARILWISCCKN